MAADGPLVVAGGQIGTGRMHPGSVQWSRWHYSGPEPATTHFASPFAAGGDLLGNPGRGDKPRDSKFRCRPAICGSACNRVMADEALSSTETTRVVTTSGVTGAQRATFGAAQRRVGKSTWARVTEPE
jgi:hypothetical protein